MWVPSGDQAGSESDAAELLVRLCWPLPSALMTQISLSLVRLLTNAIWVPSGDQAGRLSDAAGSLVRLCWLMPSAFMTQISSSPVRSLVKAILPLVPGKAADAGRAEAARAATTTATVISTVVVHLGNFTAHPPFWLG